MNLNHNLISTSLQTNLKQHKSISLNSTSTHLTHPNHKTKTIVKKSYRVITTSAGLNVNKTPKPNPNTMTATTAPKKKTLSPKFRESLEVLICKNRLRNCHCLNYWGRTYVNNKQRMWINRTTVWVLILTFVDQVNNKSSLKLYHNNNKIRLILQVLKSNLNKTCWKW